MFDENPIALVKLHYVDLYAPHNASSLTALSQLNYQPNGRTYQDR